MPIGIMGRKFGVDWIRFTVFTNKKREDIDAFVCAVSLYVVETPKASIKDYELSLPIISFGIVAYIFVRRPFSKQLYTSRRDEAWCPDGKYLVAKQRFDRQNISRLYRR